MKSLMMIALLLPAAAWAEPADCPAPPGWDGAGALTSATDPSELENARLAPARAVEAALHPQQDVHYAAAPEKAGGASSQGGMLSVVIPAPGTWRVALGSAAWVDMLEDGRPVASSAHGHGCGTARKIVAFSLKAGPHVLQVSSSLEPAVRVMVMP